jgi:polyphenol oxidase
MRRPGKGVTLVTEPALLVPSWPAPARVRCAFTLRTGGVSAGPYASFNLGAHSGDDPRAVAENRQRLGRLLSLPAEPHWLEQVHGTQLLDLDRPARSLQADGAFTRSPGRVCAVLVADCLPVLLTNAAGTVVAAVHGGWRGLAGGVLERSVHALGEAGELMAWIGPGIGPSHFEVGADVRTALLALDPALEEAFVPNARGRWQCDLPRVARRRLTAAGVRQPYGGEHCTFAEPERFFSYRRDGQCGRMAALIWLAN